MNKKVDSILLSASWTSISLSLFLCLTGWWGKRHTQIQFKWVNEWIFPSYAKQRTFTQISPKWERATEWVELRAKSKRRKNKLFVTFSVSGRFVLLRTGSLNVESTPCLCSLLHFNFSKVKFLLRLDIRFMSLPLMVLIFNQQNVCCASSTKRKSIIIFLNEEYRIKDSGLWVGVCDSFFSSSLSLYTYFGWGTSWICQLKWSKTFSMFSNHMIVVKWTNFHSKIFLQAVHWTSYLIR